jgi:hypothetical protein
MTALACPQCGESDDLWTREVSYRRTRWVNDGEGNFFPSYGEEYSDGKENKAECGHCGWRGRPKKLVAEGAA